MMGLAYLKTQPTHCYSVAHASTSRRRVTASDWPTYRGDARRSGGTAAGIGPKLRAAWQRKLGSGVTSPVVAGDHVYVAVPQSHVLAYMWSDIAVAAGYAQAISFRAALRREMPAGQIAEAQRLALKWRKLQAANLKTK